MASNIDLTKQYFENRRTLLKAAGYVPNAVLGKETKIPLPADQETRPKYTGIDPNWNYKTAQLSPNGEELPPNATGWTPNGEPWYGTNDAFTEFSLGFWNKLIEADENKMSFNDYQQQAMETGTKAINQALAGNVGEGAKLFWTAYQDWFKSFGAGSGGALQPGEWYKDPEKAADILPFVSRALAQTLMYLGTGLGEIAVGAERAIGTVTETAADVGEKSGLGEFPTLESGKELNDKFMGALPDNFFGNSIRFMQGMGEKLNPVLFSWNSIRTAKAILDGSVSLNELGNTAEANWQASRVFYSSFIDEAVKADYTRRLKEGENPYILALELENPVAEMAGQIIFDPLNAVGAFGKGKLAKKYFQNPAQAMTTMADEVADAVKATENIVEESEKIRKLSEGVGKGLDVAAKETVELAQDTGIRAATYQAKRSAFTETSGSMMAYIARQTIDDPDEMMLAIDYVRKLKNPETRAEALMGLSKIKGIDQNVILSKAGLKFVNSTDDLFKSMKGFDKVLDEAKETKDISKILDYWEPKIAKASEKMFPSLAKSTGTAGFVTKQAEKLLNSTLVGEIVNPLMAQLYMGLSPGYVFRNMFSNTFHVFVDYDAKTAAKAFGSQVAAVFNKSTFTYKNELGFIENYFEYTPKAVKRGIGAVGEASVVGQEAKGLKKVMTAGLRAGARAEDAASVHAFAAGTREAIRKMIRQYIPDAAVLTEAGWSAEEAKAMQNVLIRTNGNMKEAEKILVDGFTKGRLNLFASGNWVNPDDIKYLDDFKMRDEFERVLRESTGKTKEEVEGELRQLFKDQITDQAELTKYEEPSLTYLNSPGLPGEKEVTSVAGRTLSYTAASQKGANQIAEQMIRDLQTHVEGVCRGAGVDISGIYNKVIDFDGKAISYNDIFNGVFDDAAKLDSDRWRNDVWGVVNDLRSSKNVDAVAEFKRLGVPFELPSGISNEEAAKILVENFFFPKYRKYWMKVRDIKALATQDLLGYAAGELQKSGSVITVNPQKVANMNHYLDAARTLDNSIILKEPVFLAQGSSDYERMITLARLNNINIATEAGVPVNKHIFNFLDVYGDGHPEKFTDITSEMLEKALAKKAEVLSAEGKEFKYTKLAPIEKEQVIKFSENVVAPFDYENSTIPPSISRVKYESNHTGQMSRWYDDFISRGMDNFGKYMPTTKDAAKDAAFLSWKEQASKRMGAMKLAVEKYASSKRDFTLLNYVAEKKNYNTVLATIYPYHFWYSGTYRNWVKRFAYQPQILGNYARYKNALAKLHSGQEDFWKYNINSNEILGLDSDNPMYFNFEQTLSPIYGLMGVDFNDQKKRVDFLSKTLDGLNRFGPSTHTLLNLLVAYREYKKGEEEAASRIAGQLIPQLKTIDAGISLVRNNMGLGEEGEYGLESVNVSKFDPALMAFSDGIDPYTRKRIGRALWAMREEGIITPEQYIDAAHTQEGAIWEAAHERAVNARAPGQISSFFFGVGFKGRSPTDIEIDNMYTEWYSLMEQRPNLEQNEYRELVNTFFEQHPDANGIMLAGKGGSERDAAYAYNVLGRIPPSSTFLTDAGMNYDLVQKFYDSKGAIETWEEKDRLTFMDNIATLGALLAVPDDMTRQEWNDAKEQYARIITSMTQKYGEDIQDKIQAYFDFMDGTDAGKEKAYAYLDEHPEVSEALDYKAGVIASDPTGSVAVYYSGFKELDQYYSNRMYAAAKKKFGDDIFDLQSEYFSLDKSQRRTFLNKHPQLKAYWSALDEAKNIVNKQVAVVGSMLSEGRYAELRSDADTTGEQQIVDAIGQQQDPNMNVTLVQWQQIVGPVVFDYAMSALDGRELTSTQQKILDTQAEALGMDSDQLMQYIMSAAIKQQQGLQITQ